MQPLDEPVWPTPDVQEAVAAEQRQQHAAVELRNARMRQVQVAMLSTPQGREWLWGLLNGCRLWDERKLTDSGYYNGFLEGEREIGMQLLRDLVRASPDGFARMITENYV